MSDVGSVLPNVDPRAPFTVGAEGREGEEGVGEREVMAQLGWFEVGEGDSNGSWGGWMGWVRWSVAAVGS